MIKFKYIIYSLLLSCLFSCKSQNIVKHENGTYTLKVSGNGSKSNSYLKNRLELKAQNLCNPMNYEYVGTGRFISKGSSSQSIGPTSGSDPSSTTKTYTRSIKCI